MMRAITNYYSDIVRPTIERERGQRFGKITADNADAAMAWQQDRIRELLDETPEQRRQRVMEALNEPNKPTYSMEGSVEFEVEDGGMALVSQAIADPHGDPDIGLFVRIQSYDHTKNHAQAHALEGRRVRVTIEVLDPPSATAGPELG